MTYYIKYEIIRLLLIFALTSTGYFSSAQTKEKLREEIKTLLAEQKLSGALWTIVSDSGKITVDAHGYKNVKTKAPLSQTDKVHVGSVSKTILAAGFLRMATLGLLELDDPVKKYLPRLPIKNPWDAGTPITVRHLLDHTSGLTDAKLWHVFSTTAAPDTPLELTQLTGSGILKAQTKPGTTYSYSNLGYTILGMIVEKITGKKYEDYLDENLLQPLGMANSSFGFISQATDNRLAFGHFDSGEPVAAMPMYLRPAGQLTTTAEDVGKFLRFMMSDGTLDGKAFIRSQYLRSVGKQTRTDAYTNGVPVGDALGAYSRDRYGVVGIAKNGNTLGFSSMIYLFPEHKKAFFIVFNMDSETANYEAFNELLVKHLELPTQNFVASGRVLDDEVKNWGGYYVPAITKVEPFHLLDIVFSHTRVDLSESGAVLTPCQGKVKTLNYQGKQLFSMKDRTMVSHAFFINAAGDRVITDGVKTIKKTNGANIFFISLSLFLGIIGLIYSLISGCIAVIRHRLAFRNAPITWSFVAVLILFTALASIVIQPFMRMGDFTIGNALLALATTLLPIFSLISLVLLIKGPSVYLKTGLFWANVFIFQLCVLLIANGLMPIIMWR